MMEKGVQILWDLQMLIGQGILIVKDQHQVTARGAMHWSSKRQTSTTLSSIEAEYMSLTQAAKEALWLRKLLGDLGYQQSVATPFYCDNQSAIALSQNPKYHSRMKHIEVQHHYI
jgi:hypothetical protein